MPEPTLQATALRYAARDLTASEASAFEARLTDDQEAREALAEAVRLSAAALGQRPPAAHATFLASARERLTGRVLPGFARRAYRGHPLAWAGFGAVLVATCVVIGLTLADFEPVRDRDGAETTMPTSTTPERPVATALVLAGPHDAEPGSLAGCGNDSPCNSVAEIWANLSTPDQVEKLHDDEMRWRDKLRELGIHPGSRAERRDQ
jgi:hypothetical protein